MTRRTASMMAPDELRAVERQMRYLVEADGRLSEIKNRTRCAKHFINRRDPEHAAEELVHLINEARRLLLHFEAWDCYVISSEKKESAP